MKTVAGSGPRGPRFRFAVEGMLDELFEPVLALLFPAVHAAVDWSAPWESLDAQLAEIVRGTELGPAAADKLFKVRLLDGREAWLLVHVEVQAQHDVDFPWRMFVYHYRIIDRFHPIEVVSLAILGAGSRSWRPAEFVRGRLGCEVRLTYPVAKLLDFAGRQAELEATDNPAGLVIAAHLESLATHGDRPTRAAAKRRLLRQPFGRGWTERRIREVFRLIDWLLELPEGIDRPLKQQVYDESQREAAMPFVTSWERFAKEDGRVEGRAEGEVKGRAEALRKSLGVVLKLKFGPAGSAFAAELQSVADAVRLEAVLDGVEAAATPDDLRPLLP